MANLGWWAGCFYVAGLLVTCVRAQTTVDCNFDSVTFCNWENVQSDQFDWQLDSSVAVDGFHSIPRTLTGTGSFAYAQGKLQTNLNANNEAQLRSPQISSLTSPATLTFSYWKTAIPPTLDVCTQEEGSSLQCIDTVSGAGPFEWTQRQVVIPANPLAFRIVFRARNFNTALDIIGVDDVQFRLATRDAPISNVPSDPFRASSSGRSSLRNIALPNIGLPPLEPTTRPPLQVFEPLFPTELPTTFAPTQPQFTAPPLFTVPPPFTAPSPFTVPPLDNSNEVADASRLSSPAGRFSSPFSESRLAVNRATENFASSNGVQESLRPDTVGFVTGPNEELPGGCNAVECSFARDLCSWENLRDDSYDWSQTNGERQSASGDAIGSQGDQSNAHIFVSGEGRDAQQRAGIRSAEFVVPAGAFVEFAAYISDQLIGRLAVYQNNRQGVPNPIQSATLIWDRTGYDSIGGGGWRRLRVPIKASSYPLTLLFVVDGLSLPQHVIGLDDVKLVNSLGEEIGCGNNVNSFGQALNRGVDPQDIIPERLTAFQQPSSSPSYPTTRYSNIIPQRIEFEQPDSLRGVNDINIGVSNEHSVLPPGTTLPEPPTAIEDRQEQFRNIAEGRQQYFRTTADDRQERFRTTAVVQDPFLSALRPIVPVNAREHQQSLVLSALNLKPSAVESFEASEPSSLSAIVPILGNAFAPIERVVEEETARDSVVQPAQLTLQESETDPPPPPPPPEGFQAAIEPLQPIKAEVTEPEVDPDDPQTQQVLNRLTKDIERLFGIPISQTVGLDKGAALYSQAKQLSAAGDRPLTKENLDFILQNALAG
uniref:MAM domain-containing protein n=1 Tax=Plectus sambesii TaxID=2011161 RepID=A0A914WGT7_9BILA